MPTTFSDGLHAWGQLYQVVVPMSYLFSFQKPMRNLLNMQKGVRNRMFAALPAVQALEREDRERDDWTPPVFDEVEDKQEIVEDRLSDLC